MGAYRFLFGLMQREQPQLLPAFHELAFGSLCMMFVDFVGGFALASLELHDRHT